MADGYPEHAAVTPTAGQLAATRAVAAASPRGPVRTLLWLADRQRGTSSAAAHRSPQALRHVPRSDAPRASLRSGGVAWGLDAMRRLSGSPWKLMGGPPPRSAPWGRLEVATRSNDRGRGPP